MAFGYYVLKKLADESSPEEKWTFSSRAKAIEFLIPRLCWGCRHDIENKLVTENHQETGKLESIVGEDPFNTDCGRKYELILINEEYYKKRLEQAMQEMTKLFETVEEPVGYATEEQNEDLSQENDKSNRMD